MEEVLASIESAVGETQAVDGGRKEFPQVRKYYPAGSCGGCVRLWCKEGRQIY